MTEPSVKKPMALIEFGDSYKNNFKQLFLQMHKQIIQHGT